MKRPYPWIALALAILAAAGLYWVAPHGFQPHGSAHAPTSMPASPATPRPASRRNDGLTAAERDALASLPAGTGLGPDPREVRCHQDYVARAQVLRGGIDPGESPDAALAHALLMRVLDDGDARSRDAALRALGTAAARWPDDVDLARQYFRECAASRACDRDAAMAELQRADARNMATWLDAMDLARRRGDDAGAHAALTRAAQATGYDSGLGAAFIALRPALASLPLPASCDGALQSLASDLGRTPTAVDYADMVAMSNEMAVSLPGRSMLSICRRPGSDAATRDCRTVLGRLADADTLVERMYPLRLLIELERDPAASAALRERYRRTLWLASAMAPEIPKIDGFLWRTWAEGELPLLQRHAESIGRWPPPADWLPDNPEQRALIAGAPQR